MSKKRRALFLGLLVAMLTLLLTACGGNEGNDDFFDPQLGWLDGAETTLDVGWTGIDMNIEADLVLMMWGGGGMVWEQDIGSGHIDPASITAGRFAGIVPVAQVFNTLFPNVRIHYYSPGWQNNWINQRNMFAMEHGMEADVFMTDNLVAEIIGGHIADLTLFADDPVFDLFNPTIMRMMTHHDRLWGVPSHIVPYGIFVSRTLAENQNIDVPPVDWTLREFDDFARNSRADDFYALGGVPWSIFNTLDQGFHHQLLWRQPGEPFVRMDTDSMRDIHRIVPGLAMHTLGFGGASTVWIDGRSHWRLFAEGALLMFASDAWMLANAASPAHPDRVQIADWDLYPRPSSDWVGNHLGTVLDPLVARNFIMADGDPMTFTREQYTQLQLAWEFIRFFTADIRSYQARANFTFGAYGHAALAEGFPFVTGQLFYDMMDLYFVPEQRRALANQTRFPGFHYVMQLWEHGQFWGLWGNAFPMSGQWEGGMRAIPYEWNNRASAAAIGAAVNEPHWFDQFAMHLPAWDSAFNDRWQERFDQILEAMFTWYPPGVRRPSF